jgi:hypothetical protein
MDSCELSKNVGPVTTLEQELQRKLKVRDRKLQELAIKRQKQRLDLIASCESSDSNMRKTLRL